MARPTNLRLLASNLFQVSNTLFITNDFPPRPGGIQTFVHEIVRQFDPNSVSVLTSEWNGSNEFDQKQQFEVVRANKKLLLPTPETLNLARNLILKNNVDQVIFGAAAPLALLAKPIRELGVSKIISFTHGHETGWAKTPITSQLLKKIGNDVDVLTYLTEFTKKGIAKGISTESELKMRQLLPAVNPDLFTPKNKDRGNELRKAVGFAERPTILSVSRLMARKGHDLLITALPEIKKLIPNVALLIVGDGPHRNQLEKLVQKLDLTKDVHFTGKVLFSDLPAWYAAGDVFAMPCRTRKAGWDVEGLGIVYLEASATGIPVIAGDSGGAPEAVLDGKSGFVVSGTDPSQLIDRIVTLFSNPALIDQMGSFGRQWVLDEWTWQKPFNRLQALLAGKDPDLEMTLT